MQKALQRGIFIIYKEPLRRGKGTTHKSRGQSLVEVAIAFPVLIILFSGVVEFGFIIKLLSFITGCHT